jgi:hypothetical protein
MRGVLFTASGADPARRARRPRRHRGVRRLRGRRIIAVGLVAGFVISLMTVIVMPTRYVATASVQMRPGSSFQIPKDASYTPRAQLYGSLGPRQQRAVVALSATAGSRRRARMLAEGKVSRYAKLAPVQSATIEIHASPRSVRDVLLGLIAGAFVALAYTITIQRWRGSFNW